MSYQPPGPDPTAGALAAARDAYAQGRGGEAEDLCRRILGAQPNNLDALLLLSGIATGTGRIPLAHQLLRAAVGYAPDCMPALVRLAGVLCMLGMPIEAVDFSRRAVSLAPGDPEARYIFGLCCLELWRIPEAIEAFQRVTDLAPGYAPAFDRLGYALQLDNRDTESIAACRHAIELTQGLPNCYVNLAKVLRRQGASEEADAVLEEATRVYSTSAVQLHGLALAHRNVGDANRAEQALRQSIELDGGAPAPQLLLGQMLQEAGRFEEASEVLKTALGKHPENTAIYHGLVYGGKVTAADADLIEAIKRLIERPELTPKERYELHYSLGKAFDDLADYANAMAHFRDANRLQERSPAEVSQARSNFSGRIDTLIRTVTPEFLEEHKGSGSDSAAPVFIMGMPRSGTTLTDQIISNHPDVAAMGELPYFLAAASKLLDPSTLPRPESVAELAKSYLRAMHSTADDKARVTNKTVDNLLNAGLIHLAFPNARMIYCRRNPIDTCVSIFVTPMNVPFSHSFSDAAFAYHAYQRLVDHWRHVLPADRFFELDYEELVADPEPVVRRVIDFLGLSWEDSVLAYEGNERTIHTASRWQARQPIHTGSVERWRRYEPWIGELLSEFAGSN